MDLLVYYGFIILAFVGGFITCALLAFSRGNDTADGQDQPEVDTHA